MYKLHISVPLDGTKSYDFKTKPTFEDMYGYLDCNMIQISTGYLPEWSNRKDGYTDIYFDEEGKFKELVIPNKHITNAWYKWQEKTGHQSLPGDYIAGKVAVIQKVNDELGTGSEFNEDKVL